MFALALFDADLKQKVSTLVKGHSYQNSAHSVSWVLLFLGRGFKPPPTPFLCLTRRAACQALFINMSGWPELYICTINDRMYGDSPAKNTVCELYIPINVWFWPTLII